MNMMADKDYVLPFADFVDMLQEQYDYLVEGGTSYRQRTAELSLEVARKVGNVDPFYDKIEAGKEVTQLFPNLEADRKRDVAKMLSVVANRLYLNATLPEEIKEHVRQKMNNEKKVTLIKNKDNNF